MALQNWAARRSQNKVSLKDACFENVTTRWTRQLIFLDYSKHRLLQQQQQQQQALLLRRRQRVALQQVSFFIALSYVPSESFMECGIALDV